jgi:hypothetical protein
MRSPFRRSMMAVGITALVAVLSVLVRPTAGQQSSAGVRMPDGRPNLNGIWQALNTANDDLVTHGARSALAVTRGPLGPVPAAPVLALGAEGGISAGLGVVEGDTIPYKPEALATKKANFENSLIRDPIVKCFMPGTPRATYMPYPFQIVQGTNSIMAIYEFAGATRTIHLDKVPPAPSDTWMGHSYGRWEGDTLVVDVQNFNDQTWFDRAGDFHSDELHVVERYTRTDPDHLLYEATITDPKVFTRPWKISMPLYRRIDKNAQVMEYKCVEFVEELLYGHLRKQPIKQHWEGDLGIPAGTLIVDVTRKPPVIP